jgi:hypothetical protein
VILLVTTKHIREITYDDMELKELFGVPEGYKIIDIVVSDDMREVSSMRVTIQKE